ncbi:MAG: hypothetical protein JO099_09490, partial [Acidobacteriia bacterium]|nr:hypothetical protein [Terriglobia bacterium]
MRCLLVAFACVALPALAQDPREIVRKSLELDQANWLRRADYTWVMRSTERHFDSQKHVTSEHEEGTETIVLDGQPYERLIERDHKPLPPAEQTKEQEKLDKAVAKLEKETPEQRQRRIDQHEQERQ